MSKSKKAAAPEPTVQQIRLKMGCTVADSASVLACYKHVVEVITPNVATDFPNLPVALATLATQASAVTTAEENVHKAADAVATRQAVTKTLFGSLKTNMAYCETQLLGLSADSALARAKRSGYEIHGAVTHQKPLLQASQASAGAPVVLSANKTLVMGAENLNKAVTFHWQGRKVAAENAPVLPWTQYPSTPKPETSVPNLPPLTSMEFEVAATFDEEQHPWMGSAKLIVH